MSDEHDNALSEDEAEDRARAPEAGGAALAEAAEPVIPDEEPKRSAFVDDDTVIEATWEGAESIAPVAFTYKPMNAVEHAAYLSKLSKFVNRKHPDAGKIQSIHAKMVASRIVEWDLLDGAGKPVPCTQRVILRGLLGVALDGLVAIIENGSQSLRDAVGNS